MPRTLYLLNGPNINLLGQREPGLYGHETLADVEQQCLAVASRHGYELISRQTNFEDEMVGWLQEARVAAAGIVINPAAFSYHAISVREALAACDCPIIEVHITNIHRREPWRAESIMTAVVTAMITGMGIDGYWLAMEYLVNRLATQK